jgi:4'-phosphopantetheinyl transferase EntD
MKQFDVPHGCCTLVFFGHDDTLLFGDEHEHVASLGDRRACEFVTGRTALRLGMRRLTGAMPEDKIASDSRGAPILPAGWVGSISHKGDVAAGLVAPDIGARVGIDLERAGPPRIDISGRVLTAYERAGIAHLSPDDYARAVTLRFSIKEAIYKAVDPFVRRYVSFLEVELDVGADGSCVVHVVDPKQLPLEIGAAWREVDGFWIATAVATAWVS